MANNLGCAVDDVVAFKRERSSVADAAYKKQIFTSNRRCQLHFYRTASKICRVDVADQRLGSYQDVVATLVIACSLGDVSDNG